MEKGTYLTILITVENPITQVKAKLRALLDSGSVAEHSSRKMQKNAARELELAQRNPHLIAVEIFASSHSVDFTTSTTSFAILINDSGKVLVQAETTPLISKKVISFNVEDFRNRYTLSTMDYNLQTLEMDKRSIS